MGEKFAHVGKKFAHIINLSLFSHEVRKKKLSVVKSTNKLLIDKVDPSQDLEKVTSQEEVEEVQKAKISSSKEINDTLDLARSFKTIRRDASISGQDVKKNLDSVLRRDLKRRLDSLVLIPDQDRESVIARKPTRSVITSTPRTSPPRLPPLQPRRSQSLLAPPIPPRSRSCSPSSSLVSSIHEEVFSDSEVFRQVNPSAASSRIFFLMDVAP